MIRIDRCICFKLPFDELKRIADQAGAKTVSELQQHVDFGLECELCHPYVRRMLRNGQTVFSEIIENDEPE